MNDRKTTFVFGKKLQDHSMYGRQPNSHRVVLPPTVRPKIFENPKPNKHKHLEAPPTRQSRHTVETQGNAQASNAQASNAQASNAQASNAQASNAQASNAQGNAQAGKAQASNALKKPEIRSQTKSEPINSEQDPSRIINDLSVLIITTALTNGLELEQLLVDLNSLIMKKVHKSFPTQKPLAQQEQPAKQDQQDQPAQDQPAQDQPARQDQQDQPAQDQPARQDQQDQPARQDQQDQPAQQEQPVEQEQQAQPVEQDQDQLEDLPQPSHEPE